jgi:hypothetical protein
MPLKGPTSDDDSRVTRGKVVSTPGVGRASRDPISGARKPDDYFSIGGKPNRSGYGYTGEDISGKIERQQRKDARR